MLARPIAYGAAIPCWHLVRFRDGPSDLRNGRRVGALQYLRTRDWGRIVGINSHSMDAADGRIPPDRLIMRPAPSACARIERLGSFGAS